jgi:hypothetical protein
MGIAGVDEQARDEQVQRCGTERDRDTPMPTFCSCTGLSSPLDRGVGDPGRGDADQRPLGSAEKYSAFS